MAMIQKVSKSPKRMKSTHICTWVKIQLFLLSYVAKSLGSELQYSSGKMWLFSSGGCNIVVEKC